MLKNSHLIIWLCVAGIFQLVHSQSGSSGMSVIASSTAAAEYSQSDFTGTSGVATDTGDAGFSDTGFAGISTVPTATRGGGSSSIETAETQTHTVAVGKGDFQYNPASLQAAIGDVIEFQFFPPKHSVARAEYEHPCVPIEYTSPNKTGFYSGFRAVDTVLDNPPTWSLTINDTEPVFYYCTAQGSCQHGMVGVINPNASMTLATQVEYAKNASYEFAPGEKAPTGESLPSQTATPSPTSSPSSSPSSNPSSNPSPPNHPKFSTGALAGIAIGGLALVAAIGLLLFLLGRRLGGDRTELQFLRRNNNNPNNNPNPNQPQIDHPHPNAPPETLQTYPALLSPAYPYDSVRKQEAYDVPAPAYPTVEESFVAELPSPALGVDGRGVDVSRAGSPCSELETRRRTVSPLPGGLMEGLEIGDGGRVG